MWERDSSEECPDEDESSTTGSTNNTIITELEEGSSYIIAHSSTTITDGSTIYTITQLEEGSSYTITVTAIFTAGSAVSDPVTGVTAESGEGLTDVVLILIHTCLQFK